MTFVSAAITTNLRHRNPPIVYDIWNSADMGTNVSLVSDSVATNSVASASGFVRSTSGKSTGKHYFEIGWENGKAGTGTIACGLTKDSLANTASTYSDTGTNAWTVWGRNAGARHNNVNTIAFATDASERWGFAVDLDNSKLWIWDGNADAWLQGDPETDTSPVWSNLAGTLHPFAQPWFAGSAPYPEITLYSSPGSLSRAVPSGYGPGWPAG